MRKYEKRQILKNVGSSWSALAVNVLVGIFLSPFILHRLGDAAFGVWVLIFSVTGYYGLFDLGIRSSIIRYVSKYTATGENGKLASFVNTSLFTYTIIGAVSMALTAVLSSSRPVPALRPASTLKDMPHSAATVRPVSFPRQTGPAARSPASFALSRS